jgi:hypothetical protein
MSILDPLDGTISVHIPELGTSTIDPQSWIPARPGNRVFSFKTPGIGDVIEVYFPGGDPDRARYAAQAPTEISLNGGQNKFVIFELDAVSIVYDRSTQKITIQNGVAEIVLNVTGSIEFNNGTAKIQATGVIESVADVKALAAVPATSVGLATHQHPTAALGPPSSPIPGT